VSDKNKRGVYERTPTSGRSCSLARRLFFEADSFVLEEVPDRVVADFNTAIRQVGQ
jgi:hypothetical protein